MSWQPCAKDRRLRYEIAAQPFPNVDNNAKKTAELHSTQGDKDLWSLY